MALPFIAGAILGGLAVAAFNNKDKIKSTLESGLDKGKEFAKNTKEFAEKKIGEAKEYAEKKFAKTSEEPTEAKKRTRRTSAEVAAEKAQKDAEKTKTKKKRAPRAKKAPVKAATQTEILAEDIANALEPNLEK